MKKTISEAEQKFDDLLNNYVDSSRYSSTDVEYEKDKIELKEFRKQELLKARQAGYEAGKSEERIVAYEDGFKAGEAQALEWVEEIDLMLAMVQSSTDAGTEVVEMLGNIRQLLKQRKE